MNELLGTDQGPKTAPIEEGEEYDVKIEDVGRDGDGIARIEGYVVFVSGAKLGDEVKIKINSTRRNFGFADIVEGSAENSAEELVE